MTLNDGLKALIDRAAKLWVVIRGGPRLEEKYQNPYWPEVLWSVGVVFFKKVVVFPIDGISRSSISCFNRIWN